MRGRVSISANSTMPSLMLPAATWYASRATPAGCGAADGHADYS
ncbi:MAG: hypothetical protein ACEQSK_15660 [Sphingomonadaceae bacterium]